MERGRQKEEEKKEEPGPARDLFHRVGPPQDEKSARTEHEKIDRPRELMAGEREVADAGPVAADDRFCDREDDREDAVSGSPPRRVLEEARQRRFPDD